MLKGELLANRLYELFGPIPMDTRGVADSELDIALHKRGIPTGGDFSGGVLLVRTPADAQAKPPSGEGYRFWAFYSSERASFSRSDLDVLCMGKGLERAPISAEAAPYGSIDRTEPWWAIYQRRFGSGFLSDARKEALDLMARYAHAAKSVRSGDRVLVIGSDEDGQRFISDTTYAREVVGDTRTGQSTDDLFDTVIDVEGAASVAPATLSALMRPAGVIVTIRSQQWADAGLEASSAVWQKLSAPRAISHEQSDVEVVILRKPYLVADTRFEDHADILGGEPGRGLDFSRYYVFPNVIRAIVNKQHRCADIGRLRNECEALLHRVSLATADAGAALCVMSYTSPGLRFSIDDDRISEYLRISSINPHVVRWQISLAYVRGEAFMVAGNLKQALASFETCLSFDADAFHPSILTKQVGACLKLAHLAAAAGGHQQAADHLHRGTLLGRAVCGFDPDTAFGSKDDPRFFYFGEISEVLTLSSRCAYAYEQWRRAGPDGLRAALAASVDLFRSPRASDMRDIALQREIIDHLQRPPTKGELLDHCREHMSITGLLKLVGNMLAARIGTRLTRWAVF
ncbi:hypothetical protein D3C71_264230 [compost metagenome]